MYLLKKREYIYKCLFLSLYYIIFVDLKEKSHFYKYSGVDDLDNRIACIRNSYLEKKRNSLLINNNNNYSYNRNSNNSNNNIKSSIIMNNRKRLSYSNDAYEYKYGTYTKSSDNIDKFYDLIDNYDDEIDQYQYKNYLDDSYYKFY